MPARRTQSALLPLAALRPASACGYDACVRAKSKTAYRGFGAKTHPARRPSAARISNWHKGKRPCATTECRRSRGSGKPHDWETGLDNFGARYDASTLGRFMTPDWSVQAEPVPYAKLDNPQSLNLYSYVLNNPVTGVDTDGHWPSLDDVADFAAGFENAFNSDNAFGVGRQDQSTGAGRLGAGFGDAAASVQGTAEALSGVGTEAGGFALDATGVGAPAGVVANVAGAVLVTHGTATAAMAMVHLRRAGDFTRAKREDAIRGNAQSNGGTNRCERCGRELVRAKGQKGQTPPENQLHVHHDPPIYQGGGQHSIPRILCRICHELFHGGGE